MRFVFLGGIKRGHCQIMNHFELAVIFPPPPPPHPPPPHTHTHTHTHTRIFPFSVCPPPCSASPAHLNSLILMLCCLRLAQVVSVPALSNKVILKVNPAPTICHTHAHLTDAAWKAGNTRPIPLMLSHSRGESVHQGSSDAGGI